MNMNDIRFHSTLQGTCRPRTTELGAVMGLCKKVGAPTTAVV